jgi:hypothetical protein
MSYRHLPNILLIISIAICLATCSYNAAAIAESEYSTHIIGTWTGTEGNQKEIISLKPDSTFFCTLSRTGFIASTLSQYHIGNIRGKWQIVGAKIQMQVTGEKNERVENSSAMSTILVFKQDSLVLKSDLGKISVFTR